MENGKCGQGQDQFGKVRRILANFRSGPCCYLYHGQSVTYTRILLSESLLSVYSFSTQWGVIGFSQQMKEILQVVGQKLLG